MLGPGSRVNVPAALWECRGQGLDSRVGTPRKGDQPQKLAGDRPNYRLAPPQELDSLAVTFQLGRCSRVLLSRGLLCVGGRGAWASVGMVFGCMETDIGLAHIVELSFYGFELVFFLPGLASRGLFLVSLSPASFPWQHASSVFFCFPWIACELFCAVMHSRPVLCVSLWSTTCT